MAELHAPESAVAAVCDVWTGQGWDDEALQQPGAQERYRDECARAAGPGWTEFQDSVRKALGAWPYAVVVRGAGADPPHALLAGLAVGLGEMMNPYRSRVPGSPVLQAITPKGPESPDKVWCWHTDSANWVHPNDITAIACLRQAPSGGATEVLSLATVRSSPGYDEAALAPLRRPDVVWPIDSYLGGGRFTDAAIKPDGLRFRRELLTRGGQRDVAEAADRFATLTDACPPDVVALLRPGDVVLFDNRRVMHRAGASVDPDRTRLILRTKIRVAS